MQTRLYFKESKRVTMMGTIGFFIGYIIGFVTAIIVAYGCKNRDEADE